MSSIDTDGRILFNRIKRLRKIPGITPPAPLSDTSSISSTDSIKTRNLRKLDNDSALLFGSVEATLEKARIISTVCDGPDKAKRYEEMLDLLEQLGIMYMGEYFNLDHPMNLMLATKSHRVEFDDYAIYAITGSLPMLQLLLDELRPANKYWQEVADDCFACGEPLPEGRRPLRSMAQPDSPLRKPELELVLLHPEYFLPLGGVERYRGQTQIAGAPTGLVHVKDKEVRLWETDTVFPPFRQTENARAGGKAMNIYFLVLNAGFKFAWHKRKFGFSGVSDRARNLMEKTLEVVDAIYFKPLVPEPTSPTPLQAVCEGVDESGGEDILSRLQDPNLSLRDRVDLSQMLFFGTGFSSPPNLAGVPPVSSVFDGIGSSNNAA